MHGFQVDLGDLMPLARAALQGAAGAVITPSLPELAARVEQPPQAVSSAAYYDSFVAGKRGAWLENLTFCT